MASGFGTIYATNITPDPDDGIGRWSAEDFWRALHDGIRRDGRQLYPAMPYTSYRGMTRSDADAIYAYVMQLLPMKVANRSTELNFPFNIRLGMLGWNALFLHDRLPAVSAGSPPAWERGRYLVSTLPCRRARHHAGRARIPRLDRRGTARLPRSRARPSRLDVRRHAPGDHAQHEKSDGGGSRCRRDLSARRRPAAARAAAGDRCDGKRRRKRSGEDELRGLCAGCHGLDGNGMPNTVVAMRNNSTLRLADPRNLIVAVLDGIGAENFPHHASMQAMPGFSDKLSDAEAAALANYLRVTWGGQKGDVTPAAVRALR